MPVRQRTAAIKAFRENAATNVFFCSIRAAGVGLNFVAANVVVLVDPWWHAAGEMQAIDRVYRLGQHRDVTVLRFICEGTIEEKIMELQAHKAHVAKLALEGEAEDTLKHTGANMDKHDVLRLFDLQQDSLKAGLKAPLSRTTPTTTTVSVQGGLASAGPCTASALPRPAVPRVVSLPGPAIAAIPSAPVSLASTLSSGATAASSPAKLPARTKTPVQGATTHPIPAPVAFAFPTRPRLAHVPDPTSVATVFSQPPSVAMAPGPRVVTHAPSLAPVPVVVMPVTVSSAPTAVRKPSKRKAVATEAAGGLGAGAEAQPVVVKKRRTTKESGASSASVLAPVATVDFVVRPHAVVPCAFIVPSKTVTASATSATDPIAALDRADPVKPVPVTHPLVPLAPSLPGTGAMLVPQLVSSALSPLLPLQVQPTAYAARPPMLPPTPVASAGLPITPGLPTIRGQTTMLTVQPSLPSLALSPAVADTTLTGMTPPLPASIVSMTPFLSVNGEPSGEPQAKRMRAEVPSTPAVLGTHVLGGFIFTPPDSAFHGTAPLPRLTLAAPTLSTLSSPATPMEPGPPQGGLNVSTPIVHVILDDPVVPGAHRQELVVITSDDDDDEDGNDEEEAGDEDDDDVFMSSVQYTFSHVAADATAPPMPQPTFMYAAGPTYACPQPGATATGGARAGKARVKAAKADKKPVKTKTKKARQSS